VSTPICVSQNIPAATISEPTVIRMRGPILGNSWLVTPAPTMMPPENGRNAIPAPSGV
jgi:hypothetical protein